MDVRRVYREEIELASKKKRSGKAVFYMANLALDETKAQTLYGVEPSDRLISRTEQLLTFAAEENEHGDTYRYYLRAKLLGAFMRPIIYADIINIKGLNDREAKYAAKQIDLDASVDAGADVLAEALEQYDEIAAIPRDERSVHEIGRIKDSVGFLNEASPVQLGGRHSTTKRMVLPSLAYNDIFADEGIDGFLYDNRRSRGRQTIFPYQVKTRDHDLVSNPNSIPVITGRMLGNRALASQWPQDDRPFMTVRMAVEERLGEGIPPEASSTLDKITSNVFNHISNK